jgi:hypothetical protein
MTPLSFLSAQYPSGFLHRGLSEILFQMDSSWDALKARKNLPALGSTVTSVASLIIAAISVAERPKATTAYSMSPLALRPLAVCGRIVSDTIRETQYLGNRRRPRPVLDRPRYQGAGTTALIRPGNPQPGNMGRLYIRRGRRRRSC